MSTGTRKNIVLQVKDLEKQKDRITEVFKGLSSYGVRIGACSIYGNCLLGFRFYPICLKCLIEQEFPALKYNFYQYRTKL